MRRAITENTRLALHTPRHLRLDGDTLLLNPIFDWYEQDFVREAGSIKDFIQAYVSPPVREKINRASNIAFIDYNWALNAPENIPAFHAE